TFAASLGACRRRLRARTRFPTTTTTRTRCAATGASPPTSRRMRPASRRRRPASCRSRTWTRTHSNKLLFDGGFGVYDQEYQENYQPEVFAGSQPLVTLLDQSTNVNNSAWNNPADHFSKLFTEQFAATYVTGSHSLRMGAVISQAKWRLGQQYTRDVQPVTYNGILPNGTLNPVSVTLRIPTDRRNSIKN